MATFGDIVKPDFFNDVPNGDQLQARRDGVVGKVLSVGAAKEAGILNRLSDAGAKMDATDVGNFEKVALRGAENLPKQGLDGVEKAAGSGAAI